ncbi:MAG: hypothetical protein JO103_04945 [Candidatus Eremiobacteraeota bacterium]|nr:hypothetical protein [Candidatus Eremiobacteraeota bacterium]
MRNASDTTVTFGLIQVIAVNGEPRFAATSAVPIAPTLVASLALQPELHVWTDPRAVAGQVLARVPARAFAIAFRDGAVVRCRYDPSRDTFHRLLAADHKRLP